MNVYIWGIGENGIKVLNALNKNARMVAFIDNNPNKIGTLFCGYDVISFSEAIKSENFDYIIVSIKNPKSVIWQIEKTDSKIMGKTICFYGNEEKNHLEYADVLDIDKWKIASLELRVYELERKLQSLSENIGYEVADGIEKGIYRFPIVRSAEEAVERIVNNHCSYVRYGDGEFEIIAGNERAPFQRIDEELSRRLREILASDDERLLIGIANNYGNLDEYWDNTKNGIREYMTPSVRKRHMSLLREGYQYYDAYMFKGYFPYVDKESVADRYSLVKRIWDNRDIVIVEGKETRSGVGNDLYSGTSSIQRILCPTKNAFSVYSDILSEVEKCDKSKLILVILGPTSEILVYDLMLRGFQAVDVGQIDMDYEWFLAKATDRVPIVGKYVSQLAETTVEENNDSEYMEQIISKVGI